MIVESVAPFFGQASFFAKVQCVSNVSNVAWAFDPPHVLARLDEVQGCFVPLDFGLWLVQRNALRTSEPILYQGLVEDSLLYGSYSRIRGSFGVRKRKHALYCPASPITCQGPADQTKDHREASWIIAIADPELDGLDQRTAGADRPTDRPTDRGSGSTEVRGRWFAYICADAEDGKEI